MSITYTCDTHRITLTIDGNKRVIYNPFGRPQTCHLQVMWPIKEGVYGNCQIRKI